MDSGAERRSDVLGIRPPRVGYRGFTSLLVRHSGPTRATNVSVGAVVCMADTAGRSLVFPPDSIEVVLRAPLVVFSFAP
jgi:hypothetical protein